MFNEQIIELIKFIVAVIAPVLAGYIGVKYGLKEIRLQKRLDYVEKQLNNFYSPLLGIRKEIRAKSEVRLKIHEADDKIFQERNNINQTPNMELVDKQIDYNNLQLYEEILPNYNKMLKIFRDNYCLAEPETREFLFDFVEFVEVWNRHEKESIDVNVIKEIGHTEEKLKPFYEELEKRADILRQELSNK